MQARSLFNKPRERREAKKKHDECGVNTTLHTDNRNPKLHNRAGDNLQTPADDR